MGVLVGRPAPDFTAAAVTGDGEIVENFNLSEAIKGKKAVVFFYPLILLGDFYGRIMLRSRVCKSF